MTVAGALIYMTWFVLLNKVCGVHFVFSNQTWFFVL